MTHELNNPLGIILGFSELALSEDLPPEVQHYIQTIHSQTESAAQIIRNVLSFARGNPLTKTLVEFPHILERATELKSHELEVGNISVITEFSPDLPATSADPFQLMEVVLNIITNAQQAMTEAHAGGRIIIRAYQAGDRISIGDDGPGILAEHLSRIFDPFFTTKEVGKGAGLGLSLAYGIIHQHGGELWAESVVGQGATLHLELPISPAAEEVGTSTLEQVEKAAATKQILVVNDEPGFRELLAIALSSEGYLIDRAKDGEEAWHMARNQTYDGIILNLMMPVMGG
jgi:two-component system, NtrC family, sensor kinase